MPPTGKERELNAQYGVPMAIWLPRLMEEYRTAFKVAAAVGVYENTVRWWLKKISYSVKKRSA